MILQMMIQMMIMIIVLLILSLISTVNSIGSKCIDNTYKVIDKARFLDLDMIVSNDRKYANDIHTVVFAIKQNFDVLHDKLMDVSHPRSSNYGKYLNRDDVLKLASNPEQSQIVKDILRDTPNIVIKDTTIDDMYITIRAPVYVLEDLFQSSYYSFTFKNMTALRMKSYSLPSCLSQYVTHVFYAVDYPFTKRNRKSFPSKTKSSQYHLRNLQQFDLCLDFGVGASATVIEGNAQLCSDDIVFGNPQYVASIYDIQSTTGSSLASQGVYETDNCWFSSYSLLAFENYFDLPEETVNTICPANVCGSDLLCLEANLDVQYLSAISVSTPMYAWYDSDGFNSWILTAASATSVPLVMSISYGEYENYLSPNLMLSWNTEAIKLGLQGVTIVASSGDTGVSGYKAQPASQSAGTYGTAACGYSSYFPASSPYVLSVGGTQGYPNQLPASCGSAGAITTGGGFSQYYSAPEYQTSSNVTAEYFRNVKYQPYVDSTSPSCQGCSSLISGSFNRSNRGYPDLVAWSSFVLVSVGNELTSAAGTSVAAPVVAAMISLVNSGRLEQGDNAMGFINPFLYEYGHKFLKDIVVGNNTCTEAGSSNFFENSCGCCQFGYYASTGWDPVTGLGNPCTKLITRIIVYLLYSSKFLLGTIDFAKFLLAANVTAAPIAPTASKKSNLGLIIGVVVGFAAGVGIAVVIYKLKRDKPKLTQGLVVSIINPPQLHAARLTEPEQDSSDISMSVQSPLQR